MPKQAEKRHDRAAQPHAGASPRNGGSSEARLTGQGPMGPGFSSAARPPGRAPKGVSGGAVRRRRLGFALGVAALLALLLGVGLLRRHAAQTPRAAVPAVPEDPAETRLRQV